MIMASFVQAGERTGIQDKRRGRGQAASALATPLNYSSLATLEARLLAIGGAYTQARINQMSLNDMEYAVRLNDDSAGVK
jgi:hypothetical protein